MAQITLDYKSGGLALQNGAHSTILHPLWVRERVSGPNVFDPISHQRMYEHADLPQDLRITNILNQTDDILEVEFSDGQALRLLLSETFQELAWRENPEALPKPKSWKANLEKLPEFEWP